MNVARGQLVEEDALLAALEDGRLAGKALDVFDTEPLPQDHPFWAHPRVIVSPHMSGDAKGWQDAVVGQFVRSLQRFLSGEPLENVVDKSRGYVARP